MYNIITYNYDYYRLLNPDVQSIGRDHHLLCVTRYGEISFYNRY